MWIEKEMSLAVIHGFKKDKKEGHDRIPYLLEKKSSASSDPKQKAK